MSTKNGRYLIVGGYGLVGSHIADRLLATGAAEVTLFDSGAIGSAETVRHLVSDPRVRLVRGDVLRIEDLMDGAVGMDGIFHTAAFITLPLSQRPVVGMDVNVRGLVNTLEACRWRGVKKIVYSSSIAAYGNQTTGLVTEAAPYFGAGVQPASALYGIAKLMGEQLCALYAQKHGLAWMALRLSTVYGERQHARGLNVVPIVESHERIRQGLAPVIPGDGDEVHDYVYAGDVARAQVLAMHSPASGEVITIATGMPASFNQVIGLVLKACGSSLKAEHASDAGRLKSAGATINRFSIDKAATVLGWTPEVCLEEGIRRLVAWLDGARAAAAATPR